MVTSRFFRLTRKRHLQKEQEGGPREQQGSQPHLSPWEVMEQILPKTHKGQEGDLEQAG